MVHEFTILSGLDSSSLSCYAFTVSPYQLEKMHMGFIESILSLNVFILSEFCTDYCAWYMYIYNELNSTKYFIKPPQRKHTQMLIEHNKHKALTHI